MKTTDSLIPYVFMTMHPLQHIAMLISGILLLTTQKEGEFFKTVGDCPSGTEGWGFVNGDKFKLMNYAMIAHGSALVLHWLYQAFNFYDVKVMGYMFLVTKMIIFFILIIQIQSGIDFTECAGAVGNSQVMAWLTIEVLLFYINLTSLSVFIFIQNIKKFTSIRERVGLAGDMRKTMDFLNYAQDDVHWWSIWFNQFALSILTLAFAPSNDIDITWSAAGVFTQHLLGAYLIRQLYFNSKIQFKMKTKVVLGLTVAINCMLIFQYIELKKLGSNWWSSIVLRGIITYFIIFFQMFLEYK